jgi:polar amino acid transport system substrate-binding protein
MIDRFLMGRVDKSLKVINLYLLSIIGFFPLTTMASQEVFVAVYAEHEKYLASPGPYGGSWQLLEFAAQSQQLKLVVEKGSWQGGLQRLKAEKVDLIFAGFKTPEREQWALFTLPLIPAASVIYTLPTNPVDNVADIDFSKATVGVSSKSVQEGLAKEVGFEHIYSTTEREQLFSMLRDNRLDYVFFSVGVEQYYCLYYEKTKGTGCLKRVGEDYGVKPAYALTINTPKAKAIMAKINSGLLAIKDSPEVVKLFKQYNYTVQDVENWRVALTHKP